MWYYFCSLYYFSGNLKNVSRVCCGCLNDFSNKGTSRVFQGFYGEFFTGIFKSVPGKLGVFKVL